MFIDYVRQQGNAEESDQQVEEFFLTRFSGLNSIDFHRVYNYQGVTPEGDLVVYETLEQKKFPCCVFPWASATFCHDGRLSYCFVEARENRFLGDIKEQGFDEIWRGAEYVKFRRRMVEQKFSELLHDGFYCRRCSWLWSPHSQAPKNLAGGYAPRIPGAEQAPPLGELWQMTAMEVLAQAADFYLKGEVHQAAALFDASFGGKDRRVHLGRGPKDHGPVPQGAWAAQPGLCLGGCHAELRRRSAGHAKPVLQPGELDKMLNAIPPEQWLTDAGLSPKGRQVRNDLEAFYRYLQASGLQSYQAARARYFLNRTMYGVLPDGFALPPHTINVV